MATKTFSGRADEAALAYADEVARRDFGMSFGTYCGTVLVEVVRRDGKLPAAPAEDDARARRIAAWERMKAYSAAMGESEVSHMTDDEIKELIASRYA